MRGKKIKTSEFHYGQRVYKGWYITEYRKKIYTVEQFAYSSCASTDFITLKDAQAYIREKLKEMIEINE